MYGSCEWRNSGCFWSDSGLGGADRHDGGIEAADYLLCPTSCKMKWAERVKPHNFGNPIRRARTLGKSAQAKGLSRLTSYCCCCSCCCGCYLSTTNPSHCQRNNAPMDLPICLKQSNRDMLICLVCDERRAPSCHHQSVTLTRFKLHFLYVGLWISRPLKRLDLIQQFCISFINVFDVYFHTNVCLMQSRGT